MWLVLFKSTTQFPKCSKTHSFLYSYSVLSRIHCPSAMYVPVICMSMSVCVYTHPHIQTCRVVGWGDGLETLVY